MKPLNINWLTEGLIDFEYKKYQLLDYFQKVQHQFDAQILYPSLSDLVNHYKYLSSIKAGKLALNQSFPKTISKINTANWAIEYEQLCDDAECLQVVDEIIDFALPQFKQYLNQGAEQYQEIEEQLELNTVGLIPIDTSEGYLLVRIPAGRRVHVYRYLLNVFTQADEKYRSLTTTWVSTHSVSINNTYNNIKYQLIREFKELPNPATYVVEYKSNIPYQPTLYPIAKRALIKTLSAGA